MKKYLINWLSWFRMTPVSQDFMTKREQPAEQTREQL